jgi:hypothetical protein
MLEIDIPDVFAELVATFEACERALIDNEIEALNRFFGASPLTTRYGARGSEH